MPGFNQRGPMNQGPMTGRGMGRCTGNQPDAGMGYGIGGRCRRGSQAGFQNRFQAGGRRGGGFGRNFETAPMSDGREDLKNRETILEQELAAIRRQMKDLSDATE